jgi:exonuclease SbcC
MEKERGTHQAAANRYESQLQTIDTAITSWQEGPGIARLQELRATTVDQAQIDALRQRVEELQSAASESRQVNNQLAELDRRITRDDTQIEAIEDQEKEWAEKGQPALEDARKRLTAEEFAPAEQAALAELLARRAAVAYDPAAHAAARARLAGLSSAPAEHQQLQMAETAIKPLSESLAESEAQRDRAVSRAADLRTRREQTATTLRELEAGLGDLQTAESRLSELREAAAVADRQVGGARQKVDVLQARRKDRAEATTRKTAVAHRAALLRQLEEACGRKGVQALLIDQALPEIEEYANRLLERLTGGEMRISFDTTRPKKGNQEEVIETLDIKISDLTGERPYENYSGGEKFRVNFAIRLALSQLLARRAGARLQTLVIDEGFGSQDPAGRQGLVEAINMVQDEFACILVITHIDELRDKFPARIDVEKRPSGSTLSIATI